MMRYALSIFLIFMFASILWGQPEDYNHPELDWYTIETEHFFIHFHNGAERTAKVVAKIAEDVYDPVTSLYQYTPGSKFHFIIRDHDDYSNGAAFYYDNKIEVWATPLDFDLRGAHNWLRNVVTHEFTHMIQLGSARKITQRIPAFYFQAISYEEDKREDVLHGGPNVIASYPIAMTVIPGWFAEGIAQYQLPGLGYDTWDSHRDMILRTATLDNKLLTYSEMGVFGKNSLGNEKVYNHGYAFVSYLAEEYGLETLRKATRNMKGLFRWSLDGALKKATGKSGPELYSDWVSKLRTGYSYQTREIRENQVEGEILISKGLANLHPAFSPDGSKLAYITSGDNDYLSLTQLIVKDLNSGKSKTISSGVKYEVGWSPDGKKIAYANKSARSQGGSRYYDIYVYDFQKKKEKRLTKALRAHSPSWSPDGRQLIFVAGHDGTENLYTINLVNKEIEKVTDFKDGEQVHHPQWSPNGEVVLFSMVTGNGHDLYFLDLSSGKQTVLLDDAADSRDAVFSADGRSIYFSWDKTGIFNIYARDLYSDETRQLTNVIGGAFMPTVNKHGELVFSNFTSDGYKIALLKNPTPIDNSKAEYLTSKDKEGIKLASVENTYPQSLIEEINVKNFNDAKLPNYEVKPYSSHYSPIAFLPRVMLDYGTVKLGTYFLSSDVLDKYGFVAGFDVNRHGDYDLFALIHYRNLGPTLFLEAYNQVQNTSLAVDSTEIIRRGLNVDTASDKFKYNLLEVSPGVSFKLSDTNELRTAFIFSRYSATATFQEFTGETSLSYNYFIGRDFSIRFIHQNFKPQIHSEINPSGRYFSVGYDREFNKFLSGFEVNDAFLDEVYDHFNYNKVTLQWQEHWGLPFKDHSINFDIQGGFIDTEVDSFFNFFAGGLFGNRGYPYFSLEGRKMLQGRVTYRFPLFRHLDTRFAHVYLDKIFLGFFYDYGNAFNESSIKLSDFKRSVGVQLRMNTFSFYSFPTRLFFDAAYGLDEFRNAQQVYGKEWRFYFGLSFGYLD